MKIADRIKPIGLDSVGFLKNFRGEVTIDLKDVKTGEVETYHDHNLVTKALGYFLKQGGLSNPSAFNASALRTDFIHYMLGGMMCLDTAITDAGGHDDEIVRVPAGVGMTANGAYNVVNTGNPPELGSWNELESGWPLGFCIHICLGCSFPSLLLCSFLNQLELPSGQRT